jgi:hypothetical protein
MPILSIIHCQKSRLASTKQLIKMSDQFRLYFPFCNCNMIHLTWFFLYKKKAVRAESAKGDEEE